MTQQPEALRLADMLDDNTSIRLHRPMVNQAAAELHRLHVVELEAIELRAQLSQEKEVVAALLAEQDRLQCALNKRHAQVERLQVEISQLQSAPVAAVPAMVPLHSDAIGELAEKYAYRDFTNDYPQTIDDLVRDVEAHHGIGLTVGDGGEKE